MPWSVVPHPVCLVTIVLMVAAPTWGQLGILTAPVGPGTIVRADDEPADWMLGQIIEEGDRIDTDDQGYAMIFFTSGLGDADIEFDGTIVVEVHENSTIEIRRRSGRRAPIDIHVTEGRVRAFFDAGEHRDYILLSTPLGELQVTGSIIYAAHAEGEPAVSEFGTFDSYCEVRLASGETLELPRARKAIFEAGGEAREAAITVDDQDTWSAIPDLNFAAATAFRNEVRTDYAARSWVGEYIAAGDRLENVGDDKQTNIPGQTAVLSQVSVSSTSAAVGSMVGRQRPNPGLRSSGGARSVGGGQSGFIRETIGGAAQSSIGVRTPLTIGGGINLGPGSRSAARGGLQASRRVSP